MEQLCEPGAVYLTEHTARLVGGLLRPGRPGRVPHQGRARAARRPRAARRRPAAHALRRLARARSVALRRPRRRAVAPRRGAGERRAPASGQCGRRGGRRGCRQEPAVLRVRAALPGRGRARHTRGMPWRTARSIPFLPVLELLRSFFGVTEQDPDDLARRKIAGTLLLLDERAQDALPLLFEFLGVPDPERPAPEHGPRGAAAAAVRDGDPASCGRRTAREPVVLLLEDLHWIDAASAAFLDHLVAALPESRRAAGRQLPPGISKPPGGPRPTTGSCSCGRSTRRRSPTCCATCSGPIRHWRGCRNASSSAPAAIRSSSRRWCARSSSAAAWRESGARIV